jgi:NADH-quinone oxidoreductase subunit E
VLGNVRFNIKQCKNLNFNQIAGSRGSRLEIRMTEAENKELFFQERLFDFANNFKVGSQEGVKVSLLDCQEIFGCASVNHQKQIAEAFQIDEKVLKTMIKFMPSIKESVVEYEIVCCSGHRCAKNGSIEVLKAAKDTLGIDFNETTKDGRVRLATQNCFKKCNLGPNIMVNGEFYHKMNKTKVEELMKSIRLI